jgi:ketosteroid isomerase-like protein
VALATGRLGMRAADGGELSSEAIAVYARAPDGHWRIAIDLPWGLPAAAEDGSHHSSPSRQSHVSSPSGSSATATSST